ncbi:hypothetical protein INS49_004073 [Diaporthe citri]|uniref:uncharacterized protein n=1 Tax=Diaporthe citri TaxID=83186 RepID=UPI001C805745|nr:uncharacterized protein INS49_004073 [Diaporthe citri]KAG6354992.1 hypothetical protein INS49_004073 [Diaporthe citri]
MQTPESGERWDSPSEPTFLDFPPELRLVIYELLFLPLVGRHPIVEYHICDKTYEVTTNVGRFRGPPTFTGLTSILGTCRQVHKEAQPLLCDYATFIVSLRPGSNPLNLSSDAARLLPHAKTLELNMSISFPCQFAPTTEETEPPCTDAPRPSTRTRRKTWASPAPAKKPPKICLTTYLRRLESLLGAFDHGGNLRRLDIQIDNLDRTLNRDTMDIILSHMETRLKVRENCRVEMHLEWHSWYLVNHWRVARFLDEIQ